MAQTVRGKIVVVQKRKRSEARRASETEFVAGWVDALERTVDASRMRLAGDPVLVDLQTGLETYLKACLDHIGDLTLDVENSDLLLEGHCVYHSSSNNSISAALSRDGVRAITLRRGVEPEEIRDLVEILRDSIDGTSQGWDDIVTLLWDRDFRHIAYRCEPCDEWAEPWSAATDEWPEDFNDWAQDAEAGGAAYGDQAAPWTETLEGGFEFTPVEAENVRMVALIEDVVPLRERVLEAVSAMLVAEEEAASFLQCGALIGVLVQRAVGQGNLGEADRLLSRLRSIAAAKTTTPAEFKAAADEIIRDIAQADFLCRLGSVLSVERDVDLRALTNFLAQLGPAAAPTLCDLLGEIGEMKYRRAICEALALSCKNDVNVLIERLSDPRWYLVRNILYILGRIAHQGVERALGDALFHKDVRVRREAVRSLGEVDSPTGRAYLNSALRDPDKSVRLLVVKQLLKSGNERAARIIWGVIESPEFRARDTEERNVFFDGLARTGTDVLVPLAEGILLRGGLFPTGEEESRADAALALAWLGTPAALAVLSREVRSRHDAVRRAVMKALDTVQKTPTKG